MSLAELREIVKEAGSMYNIDARQLYEYAMHTEELYVPLSIFKERRLGILEALVKYLHENSKLSFAAIARLLNRDPRTVWSSYDKAGKVTVNRTDSGILIPVRIFRERKGLLNTLVHYCKYNMNMSNVRIAKVLNRDTRSVWAVLNKK